MTMENGFGGGSAGMPPAMMKLMQAKMMEQMFGLKANIRPIHAAAEMVGDDPSGSFGILGVRLYGATMTSPTPKFEISTNGILSAHPDSIDVLVRFFQGIETEFQEKYAKAVEDASSLEGAEIFAAGMGISQPAEG